MPAVEALSNGHAGQDSGEGRGYSRGSNPRVGAGWADHSSTAPGGNASPARAPVSAADRGDRLLDFEGGSIEHELRHVASAQLLETPADHRRGDLYESDRPGRQNPGIPERNLVRHLANHFWGRGWNWSPYQLWAVPLMLFLMWMPFTPPPSKPAVAVVQTDPFDNIQIVTRAPKFKALYFRKMPVVIDILK